MGLLWTCSKRFYRLFPQSLKRHQLTHGTYAIPKQTSMVNETSHLSGDTDPVIDQSWPLNCPASISSQQGLHTWSRAHGLLHHAIRSEPTGCPTRAYKHLQPMAKPHSHVHATQGQTDSRERAFVGVKWFQAGHITLISCTSHSHPLQISLPPDSVKSKTCVVALDSVDSLSWGVLSLLN